MTLLHEQTEPGQWWTEAVIYQIYPRSFASSGGPMGDLRGIIGRLGYVKDLGVDAVWLSPFYLSPQKDAGYDVADYRLVDPRFGTNEDCEALIAASHDHGLKFIVDLVPNHTSDQHEWFQAALANPHGPERERYWFRDGVGEAPPNDWLSIFGKSAWTRVCDRPDAPGSPWENDRQWYLHLFDSSQPDLNWHNPRVHEEFRDILRFWLDRGVDGFRVDVAHGLDKDADLPNWQFHFDMLSASEREPGTIPPPPQWNRPGVHDIYREWRQVLSEYGPDRALVAEAWVDGLPELAKYVRSDEMNQAFNFDFLCAPFEVGAYRRVIRESLAAMDAVGAPTTWVLSNHDVVRAVSRMGLPVTGKGPNGIRATDPQPDAELGLRRALAAHVLQAALPGSCYIYQGEELGLPEHMALDDSLRQDPSFFRTDGWEAGRDGCRIPMPWEAQAPGFGFSPTGESWLPQPEGIAALAADVQATDPHSTLALFRALLRRRRDLQMARAALAEVEEDAPYLHYVSSHTGREDVHVLLTFATSAVLPAGARILVGSREIDDAAIPPNTAVWYTLNETA
ncbi:glycoside hydrolase family 13 protein [Trueperella pecoris]|uniref:Glycoside hydrolase family 13 protein n=1 Tax=Trueperella pecoris TaxID=2733571 RepID=A0A7M1R225_9ACTO|nr:glycoside hydrolase family 13 protein [Trueperella pecoris]QOR48223.1 glycoside hydrolase family 13 protein [Trueperella pecoris]